MSEIEQTVLALMVLKLCKERGLSEAQVLQMFSKKCVQSVYRKPPAP